MTKSDEIIDNNPEKDLCQNKTKTNARIKKIITFSLVVILNLVGILVVLLMELNAEHGAIQAFSSVFGAFAHNYEFILVALLLYLLHLFSNSLAIYALIRQCGYGHRVGLAIRTAILGKYYDSITPWNSGGMPSQIAYLLSSHVDAPSACSLPVVKYTIRIFTVNIFVAIMFICVPLSISPIIKAGAYLGLCTTLLLPLLLIIFSKNVPFMLKVSRGIVKLLFKLKIVKNYQKQMSKAQDLMDSFLAAFKYLAKHKYMIIIIGVASLADYIAIAAIPFAVIKAFGGNITDFFASLTKTFYITLASGVVPTPGGAGAAEGSFYSVFESFVPIGFLFWAVLFWRILVFYMPILLGLIVQAVDWILGKKEVNLVKKNVSWLHKKTVKQAVKNDKDIGGGTL